MALRKETAWNRDDRDLLIELRTSQASMESKINSLEVGIKEINTGVTARLLNIEGNAVMKLQHQQLENKVGSARRSRSGGRERPSGVPWADPDMDRDRD